MKYSKNIILALGSLTRISADNAVNMEALATGLPFYSTTEKGLGPFGSTGDGRIPDHVMDGLPAGFGIRPKNAKFFDRASTGIYHSMRVFSGLIEAFGPDGVALYAACGPANTRLSDFVEWAREAGGPACERYPQMMASSVVRLLPNIVMSAVSMNARIRGENAIFSGGCGAGAAALSSACRAIEEGRAAAAVVCSSSNPYEYFNIDSYLRFFGDGFFDPPLCEASSALLLCDRETAGKVCAGAGIPFEPLGSIVSVDAFRDAGYARTGPGGRGEYISSVCKKLGCEADEFTATGLMPGSPGNFLSASEPISSMSLLGGLARAGGGARGISICADRFGNVSAVILQAP